MKKPFQLFKDMIAAALAVRAARKSGVTGPLALMEVAELEEEKLWLAKRDYENQLMQQCIIGGVNYESPCNWCEEHRLGECKKTQHGGRGCTDWWLRFLTEEEEKACEQRAAESRVQEDAQRGQGADEDAAR